MKFFSKFLIINILLLLPLQLFFFVLHSRAHGFFTIEKNQQLTRVEDTPNGFFLQFKASENHLGSIAIPLSSSKSGKMLVSIKEKNASTWYAQNIYNIQSFNLLNPYPFGFPQISDSRNKEYLIEMKQLDNSSKAKISLLKKDITTKYVFPKAEIVADKNQLSHFIIKKFYYFSLNNFLWIYSSIAALFILRTKRFLRFLQAVLNSSSTILFSIPLTLFLFLVFALLAKNQMYAQNIVEWIWMSLALNIIWIGYKVIRSQIAKMNEEYIYKRTIIIFFIVSAIAIILAAINKNYNIGGDDSRLFYLYPVEYFNNFSSHAGPDGSVSGLINFLPPTSFAAFTILIIFLKNIFSFTNLQMVLFVSNIIGGIVFFYFLLSYLLPTKKIISIYVYGLTGVSYVFSIFNFYTLFNSQLTSMYLISMFPLSLYLYVRGIKEKNIYLLALCSVILSVFSLLLVSLPWFSAASISFLPILIWLFWKQKKQFFLYNLIFLLFLLLLNGYWIYASVYSSISTNNISPNQVISSVDYREENAKGIKVTSENNKVFFPLLNLYHFDIQNNFHWPYLPIFTSWYLKLLPYNALFILLILYAGITMKKSSAKSIYIAGFFSFLTSIYFFTVNIGNYGINIFLFLSNHIPGFVMYRNMYDKFGFAVSISFALLLGVSLLYLFENEKRAAVKKGIFIAVLLLILFNAKPFFTNEFYTVPIWTTNYSYSNITGLNKDYMDMVEYIKTNPNASRYLWLPLNQGNISQIEDVKDPHHYYSGVSPLLFLSGKNDYSGITSFEGYSKEISSLIYKRKYKELGNVYKQFNVRYVIVNHTVTDDIKQSYICGEKLCDVQDDKYKKAVLGSKLKDFGSRYSLYEINKDFLSDKFMIQNNKGKISYKKISSEEYEIALTNVTKNTSILFLDPYFKNWEIVTNAKKTVNGTKHTKVYSYANAWDLNFDELKSSLPQSDYKQNQDGTVNMSFKLFFKNSSLYPMMILLSVITYVLIIGYSLYRLGITVFKKINKRK